VKIEKAKRDAIIAAYRSGEIKRVGTGFSVPSKFFVLGITPRMVTQVIAELERR
jgi:hypothetical protein